MFESPGDASTLISVAVMVAIATFCFLFEAYFLVLAAIYGCAAAELYNRTSLGRRIRSRLSRSKESLAQQDGD